MGEPPRRVGSLLALPVGGGPWCPPPTRTRVLGNLVGKYPLYSISPLRGKVPLLLSNYHKEEPPFTNNHSAREQVKYNQHGEGEVGHAGPWAAHSMLTA